MIRNNGRLDVKALETRYENEATIQARVNEANKTWELLMYKNERAMTFEDFSKKLTKARALVLLPPYPLLYLDLYF